MSTDVRPRAEQSSRRGVSRHRPPRAELQRPEEAPRPSPERRPPGAVGARLLIVDDEPPIRLLCSVNLGLGGFEVVEAENGSEAIARAREHAFDLVLLDVMLPDMGGFDVARALAAESCRRPLPVAFFSARAGRDDIRAGYEAGGVDYIVKPFDPIALAGRVTEILDRVARGEHDAFRAARLAELGE